MYISISQLKYHSISGDKAIYSTSVVVKYIDTNTIKENSEFNNATLPHDIILTK